MKASIVRVKTFAENTVADLDTAVTTFLATLQEGEYLDLQFSVAVANASTIDSMDAVTTITVKQYCAQLTYTG